MIKIDDDAVEAATLKLYCIKPNAWRHLKQPLRELYVNKTREAFNVALEHMIASGKAKKARLFIYEEDDETRWDAGTAWHESKTSKPALIIKLEPEQ